MYLHTKERIIPEKCKDYNTNFVAGNLIQPFRHPARVQKHKQHTFPHKGATSYNPTQQTSSKLTMDKVVKDHTYHIQISQYDKYLLLHPSHAVTKMQPVLTKHTYFHLLAEIACIISSFILKQNLLQSRILLIIFVNSIAYNFIPKESRRKSHNDAKEIKPNCWSPHIFGTLN